MGGPRLEPSSCSLNPNGYMVLFSCSDSAYEMAPLKVWEVQDLSLQAALRILESPPEGALELLQELSQNFPRLARSLSKIPVKKV